MTNTAAKRDHFGANTRSAFLCESGQRLCRRHATELEQHCACGHAMRDHKAEPALDGRAGCRRAEGIARCGCTRTP